MQDKKVFISYSHAIKSEVDALVYALRKYPIEIFYSGDLRATNGLWGNQIKKKLENSDVLVALLDHSVSSKNHGHIHLELQHALDQGMQIIPVLIGEPRLDWDYQGLIQRLFIYRSKSVGSLKQNSAFLSELIPNSASGLEDRAPEVSLSARSWMEQGVSARDLSLSVALIFLQYELPDVVFAAASELEQRLNALLGKGDDANDGDPKLFGRDSHSHRLKKIRATSASAMDSRLGLNVPFLRFIDDNWAPQLLTYLWTEEPDVRAAIIEWLTNQVLSNQLSHAVQRVALGLGFLAQTAFLETTTTILVGWLRRPEPQLRRVADLALAIAAENPENRSAIREIITQLIDARNTEYVSAALELVCGYTGMRLPDLSVKTLKAVGRRVVTNERMLNIVLRSPVLGPGDIDLSSLTQSENDSLDQDIGVEGSEDSSASDPDEASELSADSPAASELQKDGAEEGKDEEINSRAPSIIKVAVFLAEMGKWASQPVFQEKHAAAKHVPIFLLLAALQKMPLYADQHNQRLALDDLVNFSVIPPSILTHILKGLAEALLARDRHNYRPRMHAKQVLQRFAEIRHHRTKKEDTDPFIVFASSLFSVVANEEPRQASVVAFWTGRYTTKEEKDRIRTGLVFENITGEN